MDTRLLDAVRGALIKDLEGLRDAVRDLAGPLDERQFWTRPLEPGNSVGHLVLHLTGNLNTFVGGHLGGTGYVRDREREFTEAQPPTKAEALAKLDEAVAIFRRVVGGLTEERLLSPHTETRLGQVLEALVHLVGHFAIHRGQMSYIVRLVTALGTKG
jgi:uncharacterized damage-inducible protein DinB